MRSFRPKLPRGEQRRRAVVAGKQRIVSFRPRPSSRDNAVGSGMLARVSVVIEETRYTGHGMAFKDALATLNDKLA